MTQASLITNIELYFNRYVNEGNQDNVITWNKLAEPIVSEPITVPYLSPFVLRKELETMLKNEGDDCLVDPNTGMAYITL